jgi:hypothetical protein
LGEFVGGVYVMREGRIAARGPAAGRLRNRSM